MDIHYSAFISYRHHPEDIRVAEQIHRGLEHYKVPKALKKKRDTKLRLFRDKEELPITSNLTDDITRALRNSDFLIVICSTHTKESLWVQREIETFLQTHDHSRVLTVLVDGEPYDTIPQVLCSAEQIDPRTGETVTLPIEPLSCDWRVSRRKARREELPRLAAALLGCGYDELRQRERQYRARRLAIAASVAMAAVVGFSSYVVYNSIQIQKANDRLTQANIEIQENLEQALINQSRFLASASSQANDDGDRMLAMVLAMEALPEYPGERPYVARAERVLSEELGAYSAHAEIMTVGAITNDALIELFGATDNRERMFVFDERDVLSVWDLQNYQRITALQLESSAEQLMITPENLLLVYDRDFTVRCYDWDLQLLWQQEGVSEAALSTQRDVLLAELGSNTLAFFDTATGEEVLPQVQVTLPTEDAISGWTSFKQNAFDLLRPVILQFGSMYDDRLITVDPQTGAITELGVLPEEMYTQRTGYTADGNALVLSVGESLNGQYQDTMVRGPVENRLSCYSPQGTLLWTTELTSYSYSWDCTLYAIDESRIFCQIDSLLAVIDAATGQVLTSCEVGGVPMWTSPEENKATLILDDGSVGNFNYDEGYFNATRHLKSDVAQVFAGKGIYCRCSLSKDIMVYKSVQDTNWEVFSGDYNISMRRGAVFGDYVAIDNYKNICVFDVPGQKLLRQIVGEEDYQYELLDFSEDGTSLWLSEWGKAVVRVDLETGTRERFELPKNLGEDVSLYYGSDLYMTEHWIYTMAKDLLTDEVYLQGFDIRTLQSTCVKVCDAVQSYDSDCVLLDIQGSSGYLWCSATQNIYQVNMESEEAKVFAEGYAVRPYLDFLSDGIYMISADNQAVFYQQGGQILCTIALEENNGVCAHITRQQIFLLLNSGRIVRYDLNGKKCGEIATSLYNGFSSSISYDFMPDSITWTETGDGDLFVNIFKAGNLINMESWELRAWVPQCVTYYPGLDQFLCIGTEDGKDHIGAFDRYTLKRIQQMAREALGSYTLTQEQMEYYGIS